MACLDTTVFVDLRGRGSKDRRNNIKEKLDVLRALNKPIVVARLTLAELYVGVNLAADPGTELSLLDSIAADFAILEFTADAAAHYGQIVASRRRLGRPINTIDALIAATALSAGHSLVTRNVKDFLHVPGLQVETY